MRYFRGMSGRSPLKPQFGYYSPSAWLHLLLVQTGTYPEKPFGRVVQNIMHLVEFFVYIAVHSLQTIEFICNTFEVVNHPISQSPFESPGESVAGIVEESRLEVYQGYLIIDNTIKSRIQPCPFVHHIWWHAIPLHQNDSNSCSLLLSY